VEGEPVNPIAQRRPNRQLLRWTCAVACTLPMLAPLVAMAVASVSPHRVMVREKLALSPTVWSLENYRRVLRDSTFVGSVANSSKVALTVTLLAVPLAFAGGYALARYRSRGTRLVGLALLASQMLPAIMLAIPLYVLLAKLRLIDTHTALNHRLHHLRAAIHHLDVARVFSRAFRVKSKNAPWWTGVRASVCCGGSCCRSACPGWQPPRSWCFSWRGTSTCLPCC
jgi:ABC-type Fe3+ transport system permease subunit